MKIKSFLTFMLLILSAVSANALPKTISWDRNGLIFDGRYVMPVMGEVHYSRIPQDEWADEIRKMKDGGVTIIATYVFWNHHEEQENVFNWSGQRDLRHFIELCKEQDIPVILRLGPFCHGEVRNGGIPDWMFEKGCKMRDMNPTFMKYATRLYRQIFTQIQGLQFKDGGPVIAAQFDNEYRGHGKYLMALKKIANEIGFDLPFYTRTGWPKLASPVPFGEILPLYGDYADGFWERSIKEGAGDYYKAFNFKGFRSSTAIATEQLGKQEAKVDKSDDDYPYFTCELGGGMATAYHRRPYLYPEDAYSMALVKLGSGSNLLGYYMYHGGTNPEAMTTLNENQRTKATNYNDMPVKNYDFQCPLGEFGQTYPQYYSLRKLHLFMQDYGEMLAPMEAVFPQPQDLKQGDDSGLRWSYRTKVWESRSPGVPESRTFENSKSRNSEDAPAFVFINNYERFGNLSAKSGVKFDVCGVKFPSKALTIPAGAMCIFPVNVDGIRYATAQIIAKRDGNIYMEQIPGVPTEICVGGKTLKNVKPLGLAKPVYKNIYLLNGKDAETLFLGGNPALSAQRSALPVMYTKEKEASGEREITIGVNKVAEMPQDADFEKAAVYTIDLAPVLEEAEIQGKLLTISYYGDCARLYADGKLIADNYYYGRPFLYALKRLPKGVKSLELRVLPIQKDMPVYFPKEAGVSKLGEEVRSVTVE